MHAIAFSETCEHPLDVMCRARKLLEEGERVALVIVTVTEGGAVRNVGAMMTVSESGDSFGYISGGCIDADVRLHAIQCLHDGKLRSLRYGAGSPFKDIRLPCGGGIDLAVFPVRTGSELTQLIEPLSARRPVKLSVSNEGIQSPGSAAVLFHTIIKPKLALRIAGRGADCLALARMSRAAGIEARLQLPDEDDFAAAQAAGFSSLDRLQTPTDLPPVRDDAWTAFVLMFHDRDWEVPLLRQAINGPAFYLGAVGSQKTREKRNEALRAAGLDHAAISRIRGPIGLVPSMRDASMLAISTLAEIVACFQTEKALVDV